MTSDPNKITTLTGPRATSRPSLEPLAGLRLCTSAPFGSVLRAQDTIAHAAARILVSHSMLGADEFGTPGDVGSPDGSRRYPLNAWRVVARHRVRVMPGSVLETRGWHLPAGQTQRPGDGANWISDGRQAQLRITCTWTADGTTSAPRTYVRSMNGSALTHGAAPTPSLAHVAELEPITYMVPSGYPLDVAVMQRNSEWVEVDIVIETSGAPRIGDLTITERFWVHIDDVGDDVGSTLHSYQLGDEIPSSPQTQGPQTEATGANEPRFGTRRALEVAERQRARVGPHVLSWSAWHPGAGVAMSGNEHTLDTSSTTFHDLFDPTITAWAQDNPGWMVEGGAYAADWGLSSPEYAVTGRSLIPVRVEVYAVVIGSGGSPGVVRLQSGARDFIDVVIPHDTTGRQVAFGWLEVQREGDGPGALLQAFVRVVNASDTLRVADINVWLGHYA